MFLMKPEDSLFSLILTLYEQERKPFKCPFCLSGNLALDEKDNLVCETCDKEIKAGQAIKKDFHYGDLLLFKGYELYQQQGKEQQALDYFKQAAASYNKVKQDDPENGLAFQSLAQIGQSYMERRSGQWKKASSHRPNPLNVGAKLSHGLMKCLLQGAAFESAAISALISKDYESAADYFEGAVAMVEEAIELIDFDYMDWISEKQKFKD